MRPYGETAALITGAVRQALEGITHGTLAAPEHQQRRLAVEDLQDAMAQRRQLFPLQVERERLGLRAGEQQLHAQEQKLRQDETMFGWQRQLVQSQLARAAQEAQLAQRAIQEADYKLKLLGESMDPAVLEEVVNAAKHIAWDDPQAVAAFSLQWGTRFPGLRDSISTILRAVHERNVGQAALVKAGADEARYKAQLEHYRLMAERQRAALERQVGGVKSQLDVVGQRARALETLLRTQLAPINTMIAQKQRELRILQHDEALASNAFTLHKDTERQRILQAVREQRAKAEADIRQAYEQRQQIIDKHNAEVARLWGGVQTAITAVPGVAETPAPGDTQAANEDALIERAIKELLGKPKE